MEFAIHMLTKTWGKVVGDKTNLSLLNVKGKWVNDGYAFGKLEFTAVVLTMGFSFSLPLGAAK